MVVNVYYVLHYIHEVFAANFPTGINKVISYLMLSHQRSVEERSQCCCSRDVELFQLIPDLMLERVIHKCSRKWLNILVFWLMLPCRSSQEPWEVRHPELNTLSNENRDTGQDCAAVNPWMKSRCVSVGQIQLMKDGWEAGSQEKYFDSFHWKHKPCWDGHGGRCDCQTWKDAEQIGFHRHSFCWPSQGKIYELVETYESTKVQTMHLSCTWI